MTIEPTQYARRAFLGQCAAFPLVAGIAPGVEPAPAVREAVAPKSILAPKLSQSDLAKEVESLLKLVDPKVVYRYVPLPAEKNAWPILQQAADAYVNEPEDEAYQEGVDGFLEGKPVAPDVEARITRWVSQNKKCLELTDRAIEIGDVELPRAKSVAHLSLALDEIDLFRRLAYLKSTATQLALASANSVEAFRQAHAVLKFGQILMRAECLFVDYLVAQAILGIGAEATHRAVRNPNSSERLAVESLRLMAATKATKEDVKRATRVELCRWFLPIIASFPIDVSSEKLAEHSVFVHFTAGTADELKLSDSQRKEYDRCVRLQSSLLDGHRNPFDKQATARLASDLHVRFFQELDKPWLNRDTRLTEPLRKELSAWPAEAEPNSWLIAELGENPDPPRQLTDKEIKRARDALAKVDNPLGKHLIEQMLSVVISSPLVEMHQARLESRRLRIALGVYEKKNGRLPAELSELVEQELLPEVPRDPYDGEPFKYSAKRRVIWSVDQDGKNDGVIPEKVDPENPFDEDIDLTWRI